MSRPPIRGDDVVLVDEAYAVMWVAWLTKGKTRVTGATIRSWAQRGRIKRYRDEAGTWYDAEDIQEYLTRRGDLDGESS